MVTSAPSASRTTVDGGQRATERPWSPLRLGLVGRLGMALGGIGLVWSAIALGLA